MGRDPSGGTVGPLGDADCLYGGHIYFEKKMKARQMYVLEGTLLG
jgi:hypothetical protein